MKKNLLTSGEFASLCGTQKGTLLFYEKEGLLKPRHVSENRYRRYGIEQYFEFDLLSMSRVEYARTEDGKNILTLWKQEDD